LPRWSAFVLTQERAMSSDTVHTLVIAMFMIPGSKVGAVIGRKWAFMIGCVSLWP
jgi:hypothetical protein